MRTTVIGLQFLLAAVIGMSAPGQAAPAAAGAPIRIGITTPMQLAVGRDSQDGAQLAIDEINAKGGVLGRRLEMVVADETENPETGITAVKKLTSDEKVDVLVGGYSSGVTLAQLPHISTAKTIYLGIGAASPAITAKVKTDNENYKYIFRVNPLNSKWLAASLVGFLRAAVTPKTIPFWDAFVKRFQRNPVYTAGGAYDAIHLYAEAAARAKTIEAGPVIKELEKTDMVGTAGRIAFDDTHDLRY